MREIKLKRKIYTELQKWKKEYAPEYALFIKGARRVGKTGSLAGIKKKSEKAEILIPSEEYSVEMFPLDFEEFLWAMNDEVTMSIVRNSYESLKPLGKLHRDIFRKFREYMCVGGMPQAVVKYMDSKNFEKVDFAKKEIIELYRNDIKNQEEENKIYVGNILENIPSELSKHEKSSTFKLTHVDKNARYREYSGPLHWLRDAMIINEARNVTDPSPALTLNMDEERFKCYLLDTGLLINLSFGDGSYLDNEFYKAILTDKLHINEGMFVENVVAQCLRSNGHKILFYIEYNEKGKPVMEIDF